MESILKLGVACFSHSHSILQSSVTPVLQVMLEYYGSVEETLANKKKLFSATCNQLLCPALQLKGLLLDWCEPELVSGILNGLEGIFLSLFRRSVCVCVCACFTKESKITLHNLSSSIFLFGWLHLCAPSGGLYAQ